MRQHLEEIETIIVQTSVTTETQND
jgi:hypothetical protein